jgi:hypothetical protein
MFAYYHLFVISTKHQNQWNLPTFFYGLITLVEEFALYLIRPNLIGLHMTTPMLTIDQATMYLLALVLWLELLMVLSLFPILIWIVMVHLVDVKQQQPMLTNHYNVQLMIYCYLFAETKP